MNHTLLISLYDLGHQPYEMLQLKAALDSSGAHTSIIDLSISEVLDLEVFRNKLSHVVIGVPMHTAARLSLSIIEIISQWELVPSITLMGHYAEALSSSPLPKEVSLFASGESIDQIVEHIAGASDLDSLTKESSEPSHFHTTKPSRRLKEIASPLDRHDLPDLSRYTSYIQGKKMVTAGYVEASRGCLHLCAHCPVAATYEGRIRINSVESVVAEVENLYRLGARHITFGDPDFFNAPIHSLKVLKIAHDLFPDLTFDATIKVSHILKYRHMVPRLKENNVTFIVSAFEHTSSDVLNALDKGHSVADMVEALNLIRENSIEIRPSLLPFTPWTSLESMVELLDFIVDHDLIESIDPVMYSIRLLVPSTSITFRKYPNLFSEGSDRGLNLVWESGDSRLDGLQHEISDIVENFQGSSNHEVFEKIYAVVSSVANRPTRSILASSREVPRLSESWYCCAEPTTSMTSAISLTPSQQRGTCNG